jgi:hypothetical protein
MNVGDLDHELAVGRLWDRRSDELEVRALDLAFGASG